MIKSNTRRGYTLSCFPKGFTLIELLVVVLIIGILGAIALPQYQRAALKSRYAAMMPIAKSMADSNEVFYLEHGVYTDDPQAFSVQGRRDYADGTHLDFGTTTDYAYVLVKNEERIPNNTYVVYQKHSVNYPGEIHCEALADDSLAEGVCKSFGATRHIGPTITSTHNTWLLDGSRGAGIEPEALEDEEDENGQTVAGCVAAVAMGYTCDITTNTQGQMVKQICSNGFCRTKTYNEDGSYTSVTCQANAENVCTSNWKSATYDANGNKLTQRTCSSINSNGNCTAYSGGYDYTYDANGNMLTQRNCNSVDSNGNCTAYSGGSDYTYDANGNKLTERKCNSVDSSGKCTAYDGYQNYDYTYDANGKKLTERRCSSVNSSGKCTGYDTTASYDYTYDANGNRITERICSSIDSKGKCTAYNYGYDYTYDANGNKLARLYCRSFDSSGKCTAYSGTGYNYTYDANGNQLTSRNCGIDSNGNCTAYGSVANDYTYDANGNMLTQRNCKSLDSSGKCTTYNSAINYTYDDNGKQMGYQSCSGSNMNPSTGECIAYDSTTVESN